MVDVASSATLGKNHDGLLCPTCKIDLIMSDRQGIEIDYCPKCRGVWLDRGELDKIIDRSVSEPQSYAAQAVPPQPPQQERFDQDSGSDGHGGGHGSGHGRRRRGSFLGNLFD